MADGNWTIGERPGKSPLRDLAVKRHKDDLQILPAAAWAKANGWGHRHENGTVIGHAFYLMSEGCPRDGAAPKGYCKHVGIGMGRKRALHIAYATITEHLTSSASLETLRDGAVGACRASQSAFGVKLKMRPRDCGVVINAFHAIGVGRIDTDLDGLEDHRDNCANVYNPDQKSSKQDAEIGEACIRDDGTKVVTGDMGDHAVGRIERKGMRTAPMCGSAKTARIEVTTSHTIEYAAMEKKYLQVHLDKANAAGAAKKPYFTNDPTAKTRGLNCIWSKLLVSGGSIVADGLSKDASMMLQDRLRAASPGTLDNGTVQLPEHGTVATMTAEEIWQKPAPP